MQYEYKIPGLFEGGKLRVRPRAARSDSNGSGPRLLKTRDAVRYPGGSPRTVPRLELPVILGKHLRYDIHDLDQTKAVFQFGRD